MASLLTHKRDKANAFNPTGGNDIIPMSNSGCFATNTRNIHCFVCHKTITQAEAARLVAQTNPTITYFHYDSCNAAAEYIKNRSKPKDSSAYLEPSHSNNNFEQRENSFRFLYRDKGSYPPIAQMASAGFAYCKNANTIRCCFCNISADRWSFDTNSYNAHAEISPQCSFVTGTTFRALQIAHNRSKNVKTEQHQPPPSSSKYRDPSRSEDPSRSRDNHSAQGYQSYGTAIIQNPFYPKHTSVTSRIESFASWPSHLTQTPHDLAKAGLLYFGHNDTVKCFADDHRGLNNWKPNDNPFAEHAKFFPDCRYVNSAVFKHYQQASQQDRETTTCTAREATLDIPKMKRPFWRAI